MNQVSLAIGFGLVTSAILALSAVGFTLQFGVSNIFNLAFGDVMVIAAFVAYAVNAAGADIWVAMAAGAVVAAAASVLINRLVFVPFLRRGTPLFTLVMVSPAGGTILLNRVQGVAGPALRAYPGAAGGARPGLRL